MNENLMRSWPRFGEFESQTRSGGAEACVAHWSPREWRDLQVLSQLAWMDEEYLAKDPVDTGALRKRAGTSPKKTRRF